MRLLVKFPTRERSEQFLKVLGLYKSLLSGKHQVRFVVAVDEDDLTMNNPTMSAQLQKMGVEFHVGPHKTKIEAINSFIPPSSEWDVLLLASDDMVPEVKGYDDIICTTIQQHFPDMDGSLWFFDGFQKRISTIEIQGSRYFARFGYIYHPDYTSLWCDNESSDVAKRLNKQVFVFQCIIRHEHWANTRRVAKDPLYDRNESFSQKDREVYYKRQARNFDLE